MVNKKAISPVVATALLLVVAVIAVVGFQGWFGGFLSNMQSDADVTAGTASGGVVIDTVMVNSTDATGVADGNAVVYVINKGGSNETVTATIGGCTASSAQEVEPGKTKAIGVACSTALTEGEKYTAVVSVDGKGTKRFTFIYN